MKKIVIGSMVLAIGFAVNAATGTWNVPAGDYNDAGNWTGLGGNPPTTADTLNIRDGRTATVSTTASGGIIQLGNNASSTGHLAVVAGGNLTATTNHIAMGADSAATLTISGGSVNATTQLTVGQGARSFGTLAMSSGTLSAGSQLNVGNGWGSTGVVNMTGGTLLMSGNALQVGVRGNGTLYIANGAVVTSSVANTVLRIGVYSSDTAGSLGFSGSGLVTLAGSLYAQAVTMGHNGGQGEMQLNGGDLYLTGSFAMNSGITNGEHEGKLVVNGSEGSFSVGSLLAGGSTNAGVVFEFNADANGFTELKARGGNIDVTDAILNINLDAYAGGATNIVLMSTISGSWIGTFSDINFTGSKTGTVIYGTDGKSLILQVVPEPATIGMMIIAGISAMLMRRHIRR